MMGRSRLKVMGKIDEKDLGMDNMHRNGGGERAGG